MPHEYKAILHDGTTRTAEVPDHQHHDKLERPALIIGIVAGILSIPTNAIKSVEFVRTVVKKFKPL